MKWLKYYDSQGLKSEEEVFNFLISTLRPVVADWKYYVDWDRVFKNTRDIEITLNSMNYLLGKDDFASEFRYLVKQNSAVLKVIPVLTIRDGAKSQKLNILTVNDASLDNEIYDFSVTEPNDNDIDRAIEFIEKSGLIRIFQKEGVKNLVDYVLGTEAGLSSNGRKNRGGTAMENVSEVLIKNLGYKYLSQANSADIKSEFGIEIQVSNERRFDYVLSAPNGLNIIEVNCFSSGGSKLDKTASDFRGLQEELRGQATFIWFTDGAGWLKAKNPLRTAFTDIDHILNVSMLQGEALMEILEARHGSV